MQSLQTAGDVLFILRSFIYVVMSVSLSVLTFCLSNISFEQCYEMKAAIPHCSAVNGCCTQCTVYSTVVHLILKLTGSQRGQFLTS